MFRSPPHLLPSPLAVTPTTLTSRLVKLLLDFRWITLPAAAVVMVAALWSSTQLKFDRAIESMFAPQDPLLQPYAKLKRVFGGNELVLAAYLDDAFRTAAGRHRLADLSTRLADVPGVVSVLSLDRLVGQPQWGTDNRLATNLFDLFAGYTHRVDPETGVTAVAAICMLAPEHTSQASREETIARLRRIVSQMPSGTIAGEPVMIVDGFRLLEADGRRLGRTCSVLLLLTIGLCFRSLRWVLVPLACVQWTLHVTRAILAASGLRLSMVSSMLTAIVTVVAVATVVHIIVRYRDARTHDVTPREALLRTGTILAAPIAWACLTDAVAFLSLLWADVGPVHDFGIMMATGSVLVLVSVAVLVPGLALAGRIDPDPHRAWGEARLDRSLQQLLTWVQRRPRLIGLSILLTAGFAAAGSYRLQVETDFTRNFRSDSEVVRSYAFVESHLGGAGVWDVIVPAPPSLDWQYTQRIRGLENRLREEVPGLTKVLSLADAIVAAAPIDVESLPAAMLRDAVVRRGAASMHTLMPEFFEALYHADPQQPGRHYLRIMLRAKEQQPAQQKQQMIAEVRRVCDRYCAQHNLGQPEVTGYFVLLTNLIDSMIRDQWTTFGIATAGIALMMLLAFGNLALAGVALVPNALPIVVVTGLMGWLDLKINMGAAMIAAVSMGLSVDSSIHYISSFRRARKSGLSVGEALEIVQQNVGRALAFSTLALIVGFGGLAVSDFVPTVYFGVLVSLAMLGGMGGNLVVLPLLLRLVSRDQPPSTGGEEPQRASASSPR